MTDLRKAAEMALEALEDSMYPQKKQFDAIIELRQALAQPEQEPVAWMWKDGTITTDPDYADGTWTPLFTAPPSKPWIGLDNTDLQYQTPHDVVVMRYAEAILKEKNK